MAMLTPRSMAVASSPGREKLPAPPGFTSLFIRKSRSRASTVRASPMFGVRSRSRSLGPNSHRNGSNNEGGEEPSSPKVTCIGQVRIKAGKKSKKKKHKPKLSAAVKCRCIQRAFVCCTVFETKKKKKKNKKKNGVMPRRFWPCWGIASCCKWSSGNKRKEAINERDCDVAMRFDGTCRSRVRSEVKYKEEDPARMSNFTEELARFSNFSEETPRSSNYVQRSVTSEEEVLGPEEEEEKMEKEREDTKMYISSATTTPPKNALLLMRCRSAPQHHNRFAPSQVLTTSIEAMEVVTPKDTEKELKTMEDKDRVENPKTREADEEDEEQEEEEEEEEEEEMRCSSARPLVLTRCKSEPARKGEDIIASGPTTAVPEMASTLCFWAHSRSSNSSNNRQKRTGFGFSHEHRTPSPLPSH